MCSYVTASYHLFHENVLLVILYSFLVIDRMKMFIFCFCEPFPISAWAFTALHLKVLVTQNLPLKVSSHLWSCILTSIYFAETAHEIFSLFTYLLLIRHVKTRHAMHYALHFIGCLKGLVLTQ